MTYFPSFFTDAREVRFFALGVGAVLCLLPSQGRGADEPRAGVKPARDTVLLRVPRIDRAPKITEFLAMQVPPEWAGKLAQTSGFVQRSPDNGRPATEATQVFLGYDQRALHIIFVAHDRHPQGIRARLERRESIFERMQTMPSDEDYVGIYLDTFRDGRRAYEFACNPLGVQNDSLYSEDSDSADIAFDTLWYSDGRLTSGGYVVVMSIPFKSLRFSHEKSQVWNIAVWRNLGRRSEESWWPQINSENRGILSQAAAAGGLENIAPGRNLQLVPYLSSRTYRSADTRDPQNLVYAGRDAQIDAGFDGKAILKQSLVLDVTARPDFSQVESDDPQFTAGQRYEIFYPEKRPFFTENSSYFEVPMAIPTQHFLSTRRVAQPDFGARLTGKLGRYSVGAFLADDGSPGESVPLSDPLAGKRAYFDMFRVTRDLPSHSNVGFSYAERRFQNSYSRITDIDTTVGIGRTWKATLMGAYNWNRSLDGTTYDGGSLDARVTRVSRGFNYIGALLHRAPGFQPEISFYDHSNWREYRQMLAYQFWPSNPWITRVWTELYAARTLHYNGDLSWEGIKPMVKMDVKHNTTVTSYVWIWRDAFGPQDFKVMSRVVKFPVVPAYGLGVTSTQSRRLIFSLTAEWGRGANSVPAIGKAPLLASYQRVEADWSIFASRGLTITNTYLFDRNTDASNGGAVYNQNVARSRWNWQVSRELSFRFIAQYSSVLANPFNTATPTARGLNGDFLISYLLHPGTALYVGYNSNLSKPAPAIGRVSADEFVNDGRQFFVKISYMLRF
jgi:Domain of unknown function (DUF5916)